MLSIVPLNSPECTDSTLTGNKAANLARLIQLGYRVPPGFCITAEALRREAPHVDAVLTKEIESLVDALRFPIAVRSSSTAEDAAGLAFPGIFTTVIGVPAEDVVENVQVVASSAFSDSARQYTAHHGYPFDQIRMAIILQELVIPRAAGIAFTIDPVEATKGSTLIDASYGFGELIVSGVVTPDSVEVSSKGEVRLRRRGTKREKMVLSSAGKPARVSTTQLEQRSTAISAADAKEIDRVSRGIASDFGTPQDIEWAIVVDELFILQCRPITTLASEES